MPSDLAPISTNISVLETLKTFPLTSCPRFRDGILYPVEARSSSIVVGCLPVLDVLSEPCESKGIVVGCLPVLFETPKGLFNEFFDIPDDFANHTHLPFKRWRQ